MLMVIQSTASARRGSLFLQPGGFNRDLKTVSFLLLTAPKPSPSKVVARRTLVETFLTVQRHQSHQAL